MILIHYNMSFDASFSEFGLPEEKAKIISRDKSNVCFQTIEGLMDRTKKKQN